MIQEFSTWLPSLQEQKKLRSGSDFRGLVDVQNKVLTQHPESQDVNHWANMTSEGRPWKEVIQRVYKEFVGLRHTALVLKLFLKNACKNKEHNAPPSIFSQFTASPLCRHGCHVNSCPVKRGSAEKISRGRASVFGCLVWTLPFLVADSVVSLSWVLSKFVFKPVPGDEVCDSFLLRYEEIETLGRYERITEILTGRPWLHW